MGRMKDIACFIEDRLAARGMRGGLDAVGEVYDELPNGWPTDGVEEHATAAVDRAIDIIIAKRQRAVVALLQGDNGNAADDPIATLRVAVAALAAVPTHIQAARKAVGLTQAQLAAKIGKGVNTILRLEKGHGRLKVDALRQIISALQ